ncbi:MAG: sodium/proline symporter [Pseudomonadota bacterium]
MVNVSALLTLTVYGGILLAAGLWSARRATSEDAFLLGDRDLGPWVAGLSYAASSSSAWVLLGYTGFVYAAGPSAFWMAPGIVAGYAAVWLWAGSLLQEMSRAKGHLTLTDFLTETASPRTARLIRLTASVLIAFCFSYYIAGQFQGAGAAIGGLFGGSPTSGILLGALIIVAYTLLGGFLAVSLIDTLQGLLIALVAIILPSTAFFYAGGFEGIGQALATAPDAYTAPFGGRSAFLAVGFVVGLTATGFGALGQPHLVAWIMASRDTKARVRGAAVAIGWGLLIYISMTMVGLTGRAILGAEENPESVFFAVSNAALPGIFAGIIGAATLSAIMSTVDSQLLVAGAAISHDSGMGRLMGGRFVLASRLAIVVVSAIALGLTLLAPASLFERILFAWTALGSAFGPVVVARVLGRRPAGEIILAAMLTGFVTALAFEFVLPQGPGSVWARTVPWMAGLAVLGLREGTDRDRP